MNEPRQTADTLHAAATFLELCQIWGPLETDLASKIKFAKYHAVRIARALKAGEDPNLSNPTIEPASSEEEFHLHSDDSESPRLQSIKDAEKLIHASRQPSVEEVPDGHDEFELHPAQRSLVDPTLHAPSHQSHSDFQSQDINRKVDAMPPAPETEEYYTQLPTGGNSPHGPPWNLHSNPNESEYFPKDAQSGNGDSISFLPEIPSGNPSYMRSADQPSNPPEVSPQVSSGLRPQNPDWPQPRSIESFPPPQINEQAPTQQFRAPPSTYTPQNLNEPKNPPVRSMQPSLQSSQRKTQGQAASNVHSNAQNQGNPQSPNQTHYIADEEAILTAQKHARWAISAMNFEDVNTAVKELKGALEALGAR